MIFSPSKVEGSSYINHFIQPDSITLGGPQGLNRYAYVLNNPINANDPSGHKCVGEPEECKTNDGKKPITTVGTRPVKKDGIPITPSRVRGDRTPTPIPTFTPLPTATATPGCPIPHYCTATPTATSTPTSTPTLAPFGHGPMAQAVVDNIVSGASTAVSGVGNACDPTTGGTCSKDLVEPLAQRGGAKGVAPITQALEVAVAMKTFQEDVGDKIIQPRIDDMAAGWQQTTTKQKAITIGYVIAILIIAPGFIPP